MKYYELLNYGKELLERGGIETGEYDARELLIFASKKPLEELLMIYREDAPEEIASLYKKYLDQRSRRYPLQYIMGYSYFYGYRFLVDEAVLVPRPETEEVVHEALKMTENVESVKALDLCTGSGCMGITFYLERKSAGLKTHLTLADISKDALGIAENNAINLACPDMKDPDKKIEDILIKESDIFSNIDETYDIIISNPPYIKSGDINGLMPEVREYEPRLALDGTPDNSDGLTFYRKIINEAGRFLNENGKICFEIGHDEGEAVRRLLVDNSFTDIKVMKDINGRDRIVTAVFNGE